MSDFFNRAKAKRSEGKSDEKVEEPVKGTSAVQEDTATPEDTAPKEAKTNATNFFGKSAGEAKIAGGGKKANGSGDDASDNGDDGKESGRDNGDNEDKIANAFAQRNLSKENNILDGIELPPAPDADASAEDLLKYQLDKLALVINHPIAARDTLATLHDQLKNDRELKDLLLPEHLGNITRAMGVLTSTAHGKAAAKKTTAQKKVAVKEEKAKAVDDLANEFADLM